MHDRQKLHNPAAPTPVIPAPATKPATAGENVANANQQQREDKSRLNVHEEMLFYEYKQGLIPNDELYDIFSGELTEKGETIRKIKRKIMNKYGIISYKEVKDKETGETHSVPDKIICPRLAKLIQEEYNYNFLTIIDSQEIFYFDEGYYRPNGETVIQYLAEDFLEDLCTSHRKNETVSHIKDFNYVNRDIFNPDVNLINLENGIYNIETGELLDHDPSCYFLNRLPVVYNSDAKINRIEQFLQDILPRDSIPIMQEAFGYCLYRTYYIQKAFMYLGGGGNGKSTLIALKKHFLGVENVSSVSLHDLVTNRFASANLYGKLANLHADLTDRALSSTGMFKMLTGGDLISAEQKFKSRFNFVNYAKLFFSCNKLPESLDDTEAYFRRWIPITLPNKFEGVDCNPKIIEEITTAGELSGLFNWSISGLKQLIKNGRFSFNKATEEIQDYMERLANPTTAFVRDEIESNSDCYIEKDKLYEAYKEYSQRHGLDILSKQAFTKKLQTQPLPLVDYRPKGDGNRPRCWRGIRYTVDETINNYLAGEGKVDEQRRLKT